MKSPHFRTKFIGGGYKMKRLKRIITLMLAIIILFSFPLTPSANDDSTTIQESPRSNYSFDNIPEVIEKEWYESGLNIRTDTDNDALNVLKYKTVEGNDALIVFPTDVKYIDKEGIIRDKSTTLSETVINGEIVYANNNNIVSVIPQNIKNGIRIASSEFCINMNSLNVIDSKGVLCDNNVTYYNVNNNVDYRYYATFDGCKEEIIIQSQDFSNLFSFTISGNCLEMVKEESWLLKNGDDTIAQLGNLFVYDSNGKTTYFEYNIESTKEPNCYTVSFSIPDVFLEDDIEYPIVVDPTITFFATYSGIPNFKTTQINSSNSSYLAEKAVFYTGKTAPLTCIHGLVKFPGLGELLDYYGDRIAGASLKIYLNGSYGGQTNTYLYAYPSTIDWSLSTLPPANLFSSYNSSVYGRSSIKTSYTDGKETSLSLTNVINEWKNGNYISGGTPYGIHLVLNDLLSCCSFYGSATSTTGCIPKMIINLNSTEEEGILSGSIYKFSYMFQSNVVESGGNSAYITTDYLNKPSQLFKLSYNSTYGAYTFKNKNTGKYLSCDFVNNSITFTSNASSASYWYIVKYNDYYFIISVYGQYLTTNGSSVSFTDATPLLPFWNIRFFCLDITPVEQSDSHTCSSASIRMILAYYGITYTEDFITSWQHTYYDPYWNDPGAIVPELNSLFALNNQNVTYAVTDICSGYSYDQYREWLTTKLLNSSPMIIHLATNGIYLPYTPGHYLVLKGIYYSESDNLYYAIVNDPNLNPFSWGYTSHEQAIPIKILKDYQVLGEQPDVYYSLG